MFRNKISKIIVALLLITLLAGCGTPGDTTGTQPSVLVPSTVLPSGTEAPNDPLAGYKIPTVDENYWQLLCENCDFTAYLKSGGQRFLCFELISARDLEDETITISSDLGGCATYTIPKASYDPQSLSVFAFMTYQNVNWAAFEGDYTAMSDRRDSMANAWKAAENKLPKLYSYLIYVSFEDLGVEPKKNDSGQYPSWDEVGELEPQRVTTLTVTIGEETKTYEPGNMLFLAEKAAENTSYLGGLSLTGDQAISDFPVEPSAEGTVELPNLQYTAKADVVLQSLSVPGAEVIGCSLKITTPLGDTFNMEWDCNTPIEVDEGSKIILENVTYQDPAFAHKLQANVLRYVTMHYTNQGEAFQRQIPVGARLRADPWDHYVKDLDGVDMLPYYLDFVNYED